MDGIVIISCTDRKQWRDWLIKNFETESEIWLAFPLICSGETGISYNDAVEEALCFGWIDGRTGSADENHQIRRFTPRRKGSSYSQPNIERLILLDSQCLIHPKVKASVEDVIRKPFVYPEDIIEEIRKDDVVWSNYQNYLYYQDGRKTGFPPPGVPCRRTLQPLQAMGPQRLQPLTYRDSEIISESGVWILMSIKEQYKTA